MVKHITKKAVDELLDLVAAGSAIITDDFRSHMHLGREGWDHRVVNHSMGEYTRGNDHVNTVEGLFQDLRHWLDTFKGVCERTLQLFVSMFQFNYNHSDLSQMDRFTKLLRIILYPPSVT